MESQRIIDAGIIFVRSYPKQWHEENIQKVIPKILFVEDETLIGWSVATALRKAGLSVDHVSTGEEAFERLHSTSYDLVLTDLKLPEINGIEVALEAKAISRSIPVIVLSAMDKTIVGAALGSGTVDYYLEKPFDINEVTSIVMRFATHN